MTYNISNGLTPAHPFDLSAHCSTLRLESSLSFSLPILLCREAPLTHCRATLEAKEAVGSHHTQLSDRVVNSEVGKGQVS